MVNTFLPHSSFNISATVLDKKRLGKQRVETLQILKANLGLTTGWVNHPAAVMWRGYNESLAAYGLIVCRVWIGYGYKDTCEEKIDQLMPGLKKEIFSKPLADVVNLPPWVGNPAFHDSHRSNLLRKDPEFYGKYGWSVPNDLPYLWPVSKE